MHSTLSSRKTWTGLDFRKNVVNIVGSLLHDQKNYIKKKIQRISICLILVLLV